MKLKDIIASIFFFIAAYFLKQGLAKALCQENTLACFYGFIIYYLIPAIVLILTTIYWYNRIVSW